MSETMSTRLMSAIRSAAEVPGEGHADAFGFAWHAWYRANRLSVTAHEDAHGTRVQVLLERGTPRFFTVFAASFVIVIAFSLMIESVQSLPELLALFAMPIAVLAVARAYWKASTRSLRARIEVLLDAVRTEPGDS